MSPFALSGLFTGVTSLALGTFVLCMNPRRPLNRLWCLFTGSVAIWGFGGMWIAITQDHDTALWAWRLAFAFGVLWIPILFYHFVWLFCGLPGRRLLKTNYAIGCLLFTVILGSSLFYDDVRFVFSSFYYAHPGSLVFYAFFVWWMWLVCYTHYQVWKVYRTAVGQRRKQYQHFFVAFALAYSTGSMDYLPFFGIDLYPYGNFGIILYPVIMTYAIVKYGTMDIQIALERSLAYLLLLIGSAIPAYAVALVGQRLAFGTISITYSLMLLALLLLLVLTAYRVKSAAQATVARTLFRPRYEMYETLTSFADSILGNLELHAITDGIVTTLAKTLEAKTASLYLLNNQKMGYVCVSSHGFAKRHCGLPFKAGDVLPQWLTASQRGFVRDNLEPVNDVSVANSLVAALDELEADVCLPFINKERLIGFCTLGPRMRSYSDGDIEFLETLSRKQLATAVQYGMLYEELKAAQRDLQRTHRLRSLETMAAGFAHEIRNPLTSIKAFLQLAPDRKDDDEFITGFSQIACEDVERIERLIKEILDYARDKDPQLSEQDLNEIISGVLHLMDVKAEQVNVLIHKELLEGVPHVMVDRQQIKQVLLNLFMNALDAMAPKGGTLLVKTGHIINPSEHHWAQIEVTDTGCGIPSKDLDHIFDPFYTTKHESTEREGTGLGLAIVNQIIQDHHGYIEVESTPGHGTTFFINLPLEANRGHSEFAPQSPVSAYE
jgi:two-component system, NtrC family, sensor kinase